MWSCEEILPEKITIDRSGIKVSTAQAKCLRSLNRGVCSWPAKRKVISMRKKCVGNKLEED